MENRCIQGKPNPQTKKEVWDPSGVLFFSGDVFQYGYNWHVLMREISCGNDIEKNPIQLNEFHLGK